MARVIAYDPPLLPRLFGAPRIGKTMFPGMAAATSRCHEECLLFFLDGFRERVGGGRALDRRVGGGHVVSNRGT